MESVSQSVKNKL